MFIQRPILMQLTKWLPMRRGISCLWAFEHGLGSAREVATSSEESLHGVYHHGHVRPSLILMVLQIPEHECDPRVCGNISLYSCVGCVRRRDCWEVCTRCNGCVCCGLGSFRWDKLRWLLRFLNRFEDQRTQWHAQDDLLFFSE